MQYLQGGMVRDYLMKMENNIYIDNNLATNKFI